MADGRRRRRDSESENVTEVEEMDRSHLVFVDTNLDTSLVILVSDSDCFSDLRRKLMLEHLRCFPQLGEISINALKIKRKGRFYHLPDSMPVKIAFERKTNGWYLYVDASNFKSLGENEQSCGPNTSNQLPLLRLCHDPSNNEEEKHRIEGTAADETTIKHDRNGTNIQCSIPLEPTPETGFVRSVSKKKRKIEKTNEDGVEDGVLKENIVSLNASRPEHFVHADKTKHKTAQDRLEFRQSNFVEDNGNDHLRTNSGIQNKNIKKKRKRDEMNLSSMYQEITVPSVVEDVEREARVKAKNIASDLVYGGDTAARANLLVSTDRTECDEIIDLDDDSSKISHGANENGPGNDLKLESEVEKELRLKHDSELLLSGKSKPLDDSDFVNATAVTEDRNPGGGKKMSKKDKKSAAILCQAMKDIPEQKATDATLLDVNTDVSIFGDKETPQPASNATGKGTPVIAGVSVLKETIHSEKHRSSTTSQVANENVLSNDLKVVSEVEMELLQNHDSELVLTGKSNATDYSADLLSAKVVVEDKYPSDGSKKKKKSMKPAANSSQVVKEKTGQMLADAPTLGFNTKVSQDGAPSSYNHDQAKIPKPGCNAEGKGIPSDLASVSVVKERRHSKKHATSKISDAANRSGPSNDPKVAGEVEMESPQKHDSELLLSGKSKPLDYTTDLVNAKTVLEDRNPIDGSKKKKTRAMKPAAVLSRDVKEISEQKSTNGPALDVNTNVSQDGAHSSYDHDQAKIPEPVRNAEGKGIPSDLASVSVVKERKHSKKLATSKISHAANRSDPSNDPKAAGEAEMEYPGKQDSEPLLSGKSTPLDYTTDLVNEKAMVEDRNPIDVSKRKKKKAKNPTDAPSLDVNTYVSKDRDPHSYDNDQVKTPEADQVKTPEAAYNAEEKGICSDDVSISVVKETKHSKKPDTSKISHVAIRSDPSNDPKVVSEVERKSTQKRDSEQLLSRKSKPLDYAADLVNANAVGEDENPGGSKRKKMRATKPVAGLSQSVKKIPRQKQTDAPSLDVNDKSKNAIHQYGAPRHHDQVKTPPPAARPVIGDVSRDSTSVSAFRKGEKGLSTSAKSTTEVKSSLKHEKSLFTTPGLIFSDDSSESSDDVKRTKHLDNSTRTTFQNESSSVSDRESEFSSDTRIKGTSGVERKDGGESKKPQSSNIKNVSLASIFKSSSVYKEAKLRAESQLDPEDLESQPVDCVPDSQPNFSSAAQDLMQYCNSQNF